MLMWHRYKTGDVRKYKIKGKWQEMTPEIKHCLLNLNKLFISYCNGVGSQVGFWARILYIFIPDFIGIINITGESDLHDVGYSTPKVFKTVGDAYNYWREVNMQFLSNLEARIKDCTYTWFFRKTRQYIATWYYRIVSSDKGWESFISGKTILEQVNIQNEYQRLKESEMKYPYRDAIDGTRRFLRDCPKVVEKGYVATNDPRVWKKVATKSKTKVKPEIEIGSKVPSAPPEKKKV